MSDNLFGIVPNQTEASFQKAPEFNYAEVSVLPNLKVNDANDLINSLDGRMYESSISMFDNLKPNFAAQSRGETFNYQQVNPERYINAPQGNLYGLDLTGANNEEVYGNLQTRWSKIGNGLIGAGKLAYHQFIDQMTSWDDTFDILTTNPVFKQAELEELSARQLKLQNENPIFQTQQDIDTFWNTSNFANMIQQSGYAIGAVAEIALESWVLGAITTATFGAAGEAAALRLVKQSEKIAQAIKNTTKGIESLQEANKLRKLFNNGVVSATRLINPVENTLDFARTASKLYKADQIAYGGTKGLMRTTARGFGAFYRDARFLNAAISEAAAESAGTQSEMLRLLEEDYFKRTGQYAQGVELDELKNKAYEAAKTNGVANIGLIMMTDKIAFDGVLKNFKPLRFLDDGLATKGLYLNTKKAIAEGGEALVEKTGLIQPFIHGLKTKPFQTLVKTPLNYTKSNLTEGIQEISQSISNEAVKNWYSTKYGLTEDRNRIQNEWDAIYEGAKTQFTMEGAKTFFSGFLTGSILNTLSSGFKKGVDFAEAKRNPKAYADKQEALSKQRAETISQFNTFYKDPVSYVNVINNLNDAMVVAAKNGNKKLFLDLKGDNTRHFILNSINSGTIDLVVDRFKDFSENLSVEEFKQAFKTSILDGLSETQAKTKITEITKEFEDRVKTIKTIHSNLKNTYPNNYNPSLYKDEMRYMEEWLKYKAHTEALQQMTFSKDLYLEIGKRQKDILTSVSSKLKDVPYTTLLNVTGSVDNLKDEIKLLKDELKVSTDETIKKQKEEEIAVLERMSDTLTKFYDELSNSTDTFATKSNFIANNKTLLRAVFNRESKTAIDEETFSEIVSDVVDYMELSNDDRTAFINFNTLVNPDNFESYYNHHLENLKNYANFTKPESNDAGTTDATQTTTGTTVGQSNPTITNEGVKELEVNLSKGKVVLKLNGEYVTDADPKTVKINGKDYTAYNQDYIKVVGLTDNTVTVLSNNESITFTKQEFESLFNNLTDITNRSGLVKLFFKNRDIAIKFAVNKKTGKPHVLNNTEYSKDVTAFGRLSLLIENGMVKGVMINYTNPITKELESVPYENQYFKKYGISKVNIKDLQDEDKKQELIEKQEEVKKESLKNSNIDSEKKDINLLNGKIVIYNNIIGLLSITEGGVVSIETDNRIYELGNVKDLDTSLIKEFTNINSILEDNNTTKPKYNITSISEKEVTINNVDYEIIVDNKGNIVGLKNLDGSNQVIKNEALLVYVEIIRNRTEFKKLDELQETDLDKQFEESLNTFDELKVLETIYNINFTDTVESAIDKLYNTDLRKKNSLSKKEELQLELWIFDVLDRVQNLLDEYPNNEIYLNAYNNLRIINSLLHNIKDVKKLKNEKIENKSDSEETFVNESSSKQITKNNSDKTEQTVKEVVKIEPKQTASQQPEQKTEQTQSDNTNSQKVNESSIDDLPEMVEEQDIEAINQIFSQDEIIISSIPLDENFKPIENTLFNETIEKIKQANTYEDLQAVKTFILFNETKYTKEEYQSLLSNIEQKINNLPNFDLLSKDTVFKMDKKLYIVDSIDNNIVKYRLLNGTKIQQKTRKELADKKIEVMKDEKIVNPVTTQVDLSSETVEVADKTKSLAENLVKNSDKTQALISDVREKMQKDDNVVKIIDSFFDNINKCNP